jgi:hypothetical protein
MSTHACRVLLAFSLVVPASTSFAQETFNESIVLAAVSPSSGGDVQGGSLALTSQTAAAPVSRAPKIKGFSIVLLVGEVQGRETSVGGLSGEIPAAVQKALSSVQAFLPYKIYRLYDAALLAPPMGSTSSSALKRNPVSGLRTRVDVRNTNLSLVPALPAPPPAKSINVTVSLTELPPDYGVKPADAPKATSLLFANISLDAGETVVVGTSQLGRDTGLLALLTAIPE